MLKLIRYCTLLLLFPTQLLFTQTPELDDVTIDSALLWLNENIVASPDNYHSDALKTLARAYEQEDDQLIGKAHLTLMRWHYYHIPFTIDSIYEHGEKAITSFKLADDQLSLATASAELGDEYVRKNDLARAEELIFNAINIYEELGEKGEIGSAYRKLANVFLYQEEPELAIKYGLNAIEISKETDNTFEVAMSWLGLINAYQENGELEQAIQAGDNCITTVHTSLPNQPFLLAKAHAARGDVWLHLDNYQKSLEDNKIAYDIVAAQLGEEHNATKTFRQGVGQAYYQQGKYEEALPHFIAAVEGYNVDGQERSPGTQATYKVLADCYFHLGDYENAYLNNQIAHEIFDTLMSKKIINLEAEALFKYESGKKDQAIAEQETIIKQNNRIQWLGGGLIVLLFLFLSTLFYYFRRNKKITNTLSIKNQENELLLKEIHHRVKNNLQVISSLLNMQSRSIQDTEVKSAIRESQARVQSMSLIHQKLYRGKNLAAIEMKSYLQNLADNLIDAYVDEEEVEVKMDMRQLELDVDYAIPLGLIANEIITNSLKYAFQKQKKGAIEIKMEQNQDEIILNIGDNGMGEKTTAIKKDGSGFGSELIELLTMQLKGKLALSTENGYHTRLSFPFSPSTQMA